MDRALWLRQIQVYTYIKEPKTRELALNFSALSSVLVNRTN